MYDPQIVEPMRKELTSLGVKELRTAAEVDALLGTEKDSVMVVVNSVCGCAAGGVRPGVALALSSAIKPKVVATVFAGQDKEATERARSYFVGFPPSSPSVAILKDGKIVYMLQRKDIEGHSPNEIAQTLSQAFEKHCA